MGLIVSMLNILEHGWQFVCAYGEFIHLISKRICNLNREENDNVNIEQLTETKIKPKSMHEERQDI